MLLLIIYMLLLLTFNKELSMILVLFYCTRFTSPFATGYLVWLDGDIKRKTLNITVCLFPGLQLPPSHSARVLRGERLVLRQRYRLSDTTVPRPVAVVRGPRCPRVASSIATRRDQTSGFRKTYLHG